MTAGSGASPGGDINLLAGSSTSTDIGGTVNITAGVGGTGAGGDGGLVVITAGDAGAASAGDGGDVELRPGANDGAGADGIVKVIGPSAGAGELRLEDDAGGEYVGITAPSVVTTYTLTLPAADAAGALTSDGLGTLSFAAAASQSLVVDADGDTKVDVEESADDDTIRMDIGPQTGFGAATDVFLLNSSGFTVLLPNATGTGTAGGGISLTAGEGFSADGGSVNLNSGAGSAGGLTGDINLNAGDAGGSPIGGNINLTAGDGSDSETGGVINLFGGGTDGDGGNIDILGGVGSTASSDDGGDINIIGGIGGTGVGGPGATVGGFINITGGDGGDATGAASPAGGVIITAGDGGAGSDSDGGNIELRPGALDGAGADGVVSIIGPSASVGIIQIEDAAGGEFVALSVPTAVTASYTLTLPAAVSTVAGAALVSDTSGNLSYGTTPASTIQKFSQDNVTTAAAEVFNHALGSTDVIVQVYDLNVSPKVQMIPATIEITDANNVTVTITPAPSSAGEYRVVVLS